MRALVPVAMSVCVTALFGQQQPPTFDALSRQAQMARDAKQLDKALELYRSALKLKPAWDEGLWSFGNIAYDLDRYADCATAFRRLANVKPDSAPAWIMAGLCEYRLRKIDSAIEVLSRAEALKFEAPAELANAGRLHLALVLIKAAIFERALTVLTELTRVSSKTPEITAAAGIAGLRKQWLPFEVPEDERPLVFKLGEAMASAMELDYQGATQKFEAVAAEFPQEANVHFRFGAFLNAQGSPRGVEQIEEALKLDPSHVPALVGLTVIYLKREQLDRAMDYGERAVQTAPRDFSTHVALGRVLLAKEDAARAATELELAVKLSPSSPEAHFSLASAYSRLGRKEPAARELSEFKRLQHLDR